MERLSSSLYSIKENFWKTLYVYEVYYYGLQFLRVQILQKWPKLVSGMFVSLIFMYSGSDPCIPSLCVYWERKFAGIVRSSLVSRLFVDAITFILSLAPFSGLFICAYVALRFSDRPERLGWFSMSPLSRLHHHDIITIVELFFILTMVDLLHCATTKFVTL